MLFATFFQSPSLAALEWTAIQSWIRDNFGLFDLVTLLAAIGSLSIAIALSRPPRLLRMQFTFLMLALVPPLWLARLGFKEGTATWWSLHLPAAFLLFLITGRSLLHIFTVGIYERWGRKLPRIATDLLHLAIAVAALLLTLNLAGVNPGTLFAGSAVLTAVIGLALKDTLGNLFSGLALQAQRPFEVGDWIQYDDNAEHIGQVTEINWRATKVLTNDLAEVIVPNGILTEACIRNFTKPDPVARRSIQVSAGYATPPNEVHRVIQAALDSCKGVLSRPAPNIVTSDFGDSGITYTARFYVRDFADRNEIEGNVRDRIWYAFSRAGIVIPFPIRDVRMTHVPEAKKQTPEEESAKRRDLMASVDVLAILPKEALGQLASVAKEEIFGRGELMIRQSDVSDRLFLLVRGKANVYAKNGDDLFGVEVGQLAEGNVFGEMSFFTGAPRAATVVADTECQVLSVDKAAMAPVLSGYPDLVEKIGEVLAGRKALLESKLDSTASHTPPVEKRRILVRLIRSFFAAEKME